MKKFKNDNKGFTLVELIVVLVILAILAAILVPALLGYIDEAKQKQIVLNGKSVYTAAQAVASEMYAKDKKPEDLTADEWKVYADKIYTMADVDSFGEECTIYIGFKSDFLGENVTAAAHDYYTICYVYLKQGDGESAKVVEFDGSTWESKKYNYGGTDKDKYTVEKKTEGNNNSGGNGGN